MCQIKMTNAEAIFRTISKYESQDCKSVHSVDDVELASIGAWLYRLSDGYIETITEENANHECDEDSYDIDNPDTYECTCDIERCECDIERMVWGYCFSELYRSYEGDPTLAGRFDLVSMLEREARRKVALKTTESGAALLGGLL